MNPTDDPFPLASGTVRLRRLRPGDLPRFHAYRSDAAVGRFQGWAPMTADEARAFIDEMAAATPFVPGTWLQLAIADAADDTLLGDVGLHVHADGDTAEIGFTLAPGATGRGHATAAVRAAIGLLLAHTPVQRVLGITDARNAPSARVMERAGMLRTAERDTVFKGEVCTEWVYARSR